MKLSHLIVVSLLFFATSISDAASWSPAEGKSYMVVSAQHYATQVGYDILKKGGNAIDAAVAMGYALAVVHPCCGNIGGGGFMLIRFADGNITFVNFREKAPQAIHPELFLDNKGYVIPNSLSAGHLSGILCRPYLAVGIPGTVLGLNTALRKYGTLSLREVLQPAIRLAREGYRLLPGDVEVFKNGEKSFKVQPNIAAIFLKNGQLHRPGDVLIQKNLARTLEEIARHGSYAFYHGKIANTIVRASRDHGGVITKKDLQRYTIEELQPIVCRYRGYQIITAPPPSSGGITICETLNIIERFPLNRMGYRSALSSHYILEAMRYTFADRNSLLGDPNFVKNPTKKLISKQYAAYIRKQIQPCRATPSSRIGFTAKSQGGGSNTTSYVVVDCHGNAVSVTYTLNDYFGAKIIAGNSGFFLNNELADFSVKPGVANNYGLVQGDANKMAPSKRPLSSMAPTIILKNNQLFMAIGTPGGSTIPTQLINVIVNVIDYGMNIQQAENAPRYHMQWQPDKVFVEPFAFSQETQARLKKMGYKFQFGSPYGTTCWGGVAGILFDTRAHRIYGAIDGRRPAGAAMGE
jgi:gamma-glutamyltranspeptidase/glutathione hydrolase